MSTKEVHAQSAPQTVIIINLTFPANDCFIEGSTFPLISTFVSRRGQIGHGKRKEKSPAGRVNRIAPRTTGVKRENGTETGVVGR